MDISTFWKLIDTTRQASGGDHDTHSKMLVEALAYYSVEDISSFDDIANDFYDRANLAQLWDASRMIMCGCSEDNFDDFRDWLIAQGQHAYESYVKNPDLLSDVVTLQDREDMMNLPTLMIQSVAREAYQRKTGEEMPFRLYLYSARRGKSHRDNELNELFPRLLEKLGDCEEWWKNFLKL